MNHEGSALKGVWAGAGAIPTWPQFDSDDIDAVNGVLASGRVNQWTGSEVKEFGEEFRRTCGSGFATPVANGSVALELALRVGRVGPGAEVVTSCRTFIASAGAAVMVGAKPVMADVDPRSGNVTADSVRAVLTERTRAIVPVHLGGWPCEMDEILELAEEKGLWVVEDCAQAHGARYKGRMVGSLGDAGAFSFCQDKIISTGGEGGMVTTDDEALFERVWSLKDHGKDRALALAPSEGKGFRWLHAGFGTNARMTEMQAAIGRVQLRKLPEWVTARQAVAGVYDRVLEESPLAVVHRPPAHVSHSYYRYHFFVDPARLKDGWSRDRVMERLNEVGVPAQTGTCSEIYLEEAFQRAGLAPAARLPNAKHLGETSLTLPVNHRIPVDLAEEIAVRALAVLKEAAA